MQSGGAPLIRCKAVDGALDGKQRVDIRWTASAAIGACFRLRRASVASRGSWTLFTFLRIDQVRRP